MTTIIQESGTMCVKRLICNKSRAYLMAVAGSSEDGQTVEFNRQRHCLGVLAQGMTCSHFCKNDEEDPPHQKQRYFLPDG